MTARALSCLQWRWALLFVTVAVAANPVNITGPFSTPQQCFARQTGSVPLTSLSSLIVTTNVGCVRATDVPGLRSVVKWKSVVPANLTLGNYSADVDWIQPPYFPDGSNEDATSTSAAFASLRDLCIVQCSILLPSAASFVIMLAYGVCFCDMSVADYSLSPAVRSQCCDPLPLSVANDSDPHQQQQPVTNGTNVLALVPRPASCPAALFGLYFKVFFTCQLNASVCSASSGSCSVQSGCCMPNTNPPTPTSNLASVEGAAAQWLISLLLVAVIFQLAYWVVRLRMCRHDDGPQGQAAADGGAGPLERSLRRRSAGRREGGGEVEGDTEMLEQLQGIANRVRLVLLQRHQQLAEPRRTKEEAADAALEAISLFEQCDGDAVSSDDCCPMCLDELRLKQCIRVLCGHVIHQDCMRDFLAHKLVSYRAPVTCPMCRATVLYQTSAPAAGAAAGDESAQQPLLIGGGDREADENAAILRVPAVGETHTPHGRSGRQRASSRGRRFRVAQANLAVERLLEHRSLATTPTYEPPLIAAEREAGDGDRLPVAASVLIAVAVPSTPSLEVVPDVQQEGALLPTEFADTAGVVAPLAVLQDVAVVPDLPERPPPVVELNVNEL